MSKSSTEPVDVVVIGSCMIDLISYVDHLPRAGETIHGHTFTQGFGGKGANQCVMASKLGARCAMVAKLGADSFGHSTIQNFKDNGISTEHVSITSEASSGVASIAVNNEGENVIIIVSGANQVLTPEEVLRARELVARAKVVVCQLEVAPKTTLSALQMAKELGVITILNTAPGMKDLDKEFFESADILCLNETEAEIITGLTVVDVETGTRAVEDLQKTGTKCVVLTLGEKGLLYSQFNSNKGWSPVEQIEAETVSVVDTTGAGDAFVGALAYFLASASPASDIGSSLGSFLRKSAAVASHTVTARGTQASYNVEKLRKDLLPA